MSPSLVFSVSDTVPCAEMFDPLGRLLALAASPSLVYVQFTEAASGVGRFGAGASAVGVDDVGAAALDVEAASVLLAPGVVTIHHTPPATRSTTTTVTEMLVTRR